MALVTLLVKQFPEIFRKVTAVVATSDLNLIGIHNEENELVISLIQSPEKYITIENVVTFAWQEDNCSQNDYKLLTVDDHQEICYYSIKVKDTGTNTPVLEKEQLAKWNAHVIFRSFQELGKSLCNVASIKILKFEAREAVFVFDGKVVVSFYPCSEADPVVMSIVDLRDDSPSHRQVLLIKETLLALNDTGTKFFIYSFLNNSKLCEFGFPDFGGKHVDGFAVQSFTVNSKLDLMVFITENGQVYSRSLDLSDGTPQSPSPQASSGIVTAFTKHFPSIKRLNDGLRRYSTSSGSLQLISMTLETDLGSSHFRDLVIIENKLCFVCDVSDSQTLVGLHMLDKDQPTIFQRLPQPAVLIKSGSEEVPFPLLVFSGNRIFLLLYDIEQDKLVNELMVYPSSGTVEILSSLNNWNNIHMDNKVLTLGLSNRQLYTVEFFLKTLFEGFYQLWNSSYSKQWVEKVRKECAMWENVLNIALDSVYKNIDESYSCQYSEQLLQVLIGMVIQVLAVIECKEVDEAFLTQEEKNALLSTFSKSLLNMRKLLRDQEDSNAEVSDVEENSHVSKAYHDKIVDQWKKWEKLSSEEVIEDSIHKGNILMAQSFFICHHHNNAMGSYSEFEKIAENLVLRNLRHDLMDETLSVLQNVGIDIDTKLLHIFKSTAEKDVRALMSKELYNRKLLMESDIQALQFVSLLEKLYPCTSFEHARQLLHERHTLNEDMICAVPETDEKLSISCLPVGDFMDFNQDNSESGAYCRIVLKWLSAWDREIKGRILAPHYLKNSPTLEFFIKKDGTSDVVKHSVWYYLLEHGNIPYLKNWIDIWLGFHPHNSDGFSALDKWPISKEMINVISEKSTLYVSEDLLNTLAKHGIFCKDESENISLLLSRIGRAQCDISDLSTFTSEKASLSFSNLYHMVVHYCLGHNLVQFLYTFLSNNYDKFNELPLCPLCDVPLLNLAKAFYIWSQNCNDTQLAYDAIAGAAKYVFQLQDITAIELLSNMPLHLAIGSLLFHPQLLLESVKELMKYPVATVQIVKEKFRSYPLLYDFLFKTPGARGQPDITVYQLLKSNTVFDASQLFGWQTSNTLKSEESQNEFPHFSLKSLSEQYGLKKDLTYLYYLTEGRPNYSYLKFIAQEVVLETGLSVSRVRSACRVVTDYALSNYRKPDICAACICFVELLGQDSLSLRASLTAANILHDDQIPENDKEHPEIERKFKQAYLNKDTTESLISELVQVVIKSWNSFSNDENAVFQDIILWMPVMTLSHLHNVEVGNEYLDECAKHNHWLKFLVFAQIFQVPKVQVLKAAAMFSDSCLSYHIFHSLHRHSSLSYDAAFETKTVPPLNTQKRDMRNFLYSRIGLKKSPPAEIKKSSGPDEDTVSVTSEDTSTSSDVDLRSVVLKDLFSQLLLANSSDSPWDYLLHTCYEIQNPVLALLAASYPEARLENCFFMWLYSNLCHSEKAQKELEDYFDEIRVTNCSTDDLEKLIVLFVRNRKILTLWKGVHLFLPNTPLPSLLGYLRSFMVYKNFKSSIESFQNQLWDYSKTSSDSSVLLTLSWIETISVTILKEASIACSTSYERLIMLRHFSQTRVEKSFSKDIIVPEFMKVYKLVQCLGKLAESIDVNSLFHAENDPAYVSTCWDAVKKLLNSDLYDEAQTFSTEAKLSQEQMLMLQINQETCEARKGPYWKCLSYRAEFWQSIFSKFKVLPLQTAIDFVEVQCDISDKFGEKYFLMKSIIELLREKKRSHAAMVATYNLEALIKKMWWYCIKAEVNKELLPEIFDVKPVYNFDVQDIFSESHFTANIYHIEDDREKVALGSIIDQFLCKKDVEKAFELATTFGYKCNDLLIIRTCLDLARGQTDPSSVDLLLPDGAPDVASSRIIRSLLLWITTRSNAVSASQKDVITCMEKLGRKCTVAISICHQILVRYTVAMVLKESYESLAKEMDALSILKRILVLKLKDEHVLAKSLIVVHELADKEVARFLSEEIWRSLQMLSSSDLVMVPEGQTVFSDEVDVIYDPLHSMEGFQLIVKLCQDPSVLGVALMNIFAAESADLSFKSTDQSFSLLADLCICAHVCFTAACNMDGISQILHSSQMLVTLLEEAEKFSIMVYLLVGLGRYSEMMYVFDILKSNDKLNLLFEKDMENVPNLRLTLLDYLKRCPAAECDKYFCDLASRFGMYREKAEILEMSVQKTLSQLCKRNADNNLKEELENALQILSEAAKSYCMADCLHQAENCMRLAQLVALQIYFVSAGVWIIGLNESSVTRFITDHDKFSQAYIVAEEYGKHHLWSQALLHNVVLRGDREYLHEFKCHFGLSTSMITDVVKRYVKLPTITASSGQNMKLLLSQCSNVKAKYSLAAELGYSDILSELLMGEASAYLQDLITNNSIK